MKRITIILAIVIIVLMTGCTIEKKTIGISQWSSNQDYEDNIEGFKQSLAESGYIEGENLEIIYENPGGEEEKQREIIQSFIDQDVDLIYSLTTPGTLIVQEMVQDKPIVFSIVTFPVEAGLIDSFSNSKNNLVGTSNHIPIARQYYEFERIVPNTKNIAFVHREDEINSLIQLEEFNGLANLRKINITDISAVDLDDLYVKIESKIQEVDALYSACDTLIQNGGEEIVIELSKKYKKPTFTCNKRGVIKGDLVGDVADPYELGIKSGLKAADILDGMEPSKLETEYQRFDNVIINKNTAEELGITLSQDVLDNANEIIE